MTEELLEHVARAIHTAATEKARRETPHAVVGWESLPEWWRQQFRAQARAAIAAVREAGGLF